MMPHAKPTHALPLMALGLLAGCVAPPLAEIGAVRHFKAPDFQAREIRRVVVVPFHHVARDQKAIETVTAAFAQKLQELGKFEVVYEPAVSTHVDEETALWIKGQVNMAVLASVRAKYQADAFCFGSITQYRAYEPPVLGLKVGFVAAGAGDVIWQADAVFDGKQKQVADAARSYYKRRYESGKYFMDSDVMLRSMKHFAEFASHEMLATLDEMDPLDY